MKINFCSSSTSPSKSCNSPPPIILVPIRARELNFSVQVQCFKLNFRAFTSPKVNFRFLYPFI